MLSAVKQYKLLLKIEIVRKQSNCNRNICAMYLNKSISIYLAVF